jgi:hypothetical protein
MPRSGPVSSNGFAKFPCSDPSPTSPRVKSRPRPLSSHIFCLRSQLDRHRLAGHAQLLKPIYRWQVAEKLVFMMSEETRA